MTERIFHKKLIRDKIPQIIEKSGGQCEVKVLSGEEFKVELKKKLVEEAKELSGAGDDSLVDEMADVLELLKSIAQDYGIDFSEVEKRQTVKREERGGFEKRLFLIWSSNPSKK